MHLFIYIYLEALESRRSVMNFNTAKRSTSEIDLIGFKESVDRSLIRFYIKLVYIGSVFDPLS
jgi:hypothetical protein